MNSYFYSPGLLQPKLQRLSLGLLAAIALFLPSCAEAPSSEGRGASPKAQPLQVVTTFFPMTSFTRAVAGDRATVVQLLPSNVSPHDYRARPEDIVKLTQADVVVKNGLGFEAFLGNMLEGAENSDVVVIDSSEAIATHSHLADHADHADHDEPQKVQDADKPQTVHAPGATDPHIWLDPKRAIQQVKTIREGLVQVDPQGKAIYEANAARYLAKLKQLDADFTAKLKPYAGKTFVTYHDFARYFAHSYHLKAEYLVGIPSENAAPEDVQRVIKAAKVSSLKTLLTEPQGNGNPFEALAQDLKVRVSVFDPMDAGDPNDVQGDGYITTMKLNLANLESAFAGQNGQE